MTKPQPDQPIQQPPTETKLSPGRAYHKFIKYKFPFLGEVTPVRLLGAMGYYSSSNTHRISFAKLPPSDWLQATIYISRSQPTVVPVRGILVIWLKTELGWIYDDVPSHLVGMMHGFAKRDDIRELTSDELMALLHKSITDTDTKGA